MGNLYVIRHYRTQDEGCLDCGAKCEAGHVLCPLCLAEKTAPVAQECAALVTDFMQASNRARAVDDAGPAADLALREAEVES